MEGPDECMAAAFHKDQIQKKSDTIDKLSEDGETRNICFVPMEMENRSGRVLFESPEQGQHPAGDLEEYYREPLVSKCLCQEVQVGVVLTPVWSHRNT